MNPKTLIPLFIILHLTFYIGLKAQDTWVKNYQPFGEDVSYFVEDIRVFSSVEKLPLFHLKMFQLDVNGFQPFFGFFEPVRFTAHVNNIRFMS